MRDNNTELMTQLKNTIEILLEKSKTTTVDFKSLCLKIAYLPLTAEQKLEALNIAVREHASGRIISIGFMIDNTIEAESYLILLTNLTTKNTVDYIYDMLKKQDVYGDNIIL